MDTANDSIVFVLDRSKALFLRYCADLSSEEMLHRPTPNSNCAAWLIGHLALSDRRMLALLGAGQPPLPEGFERRFSRDEGCPQAEEFGDVSKLITIFTLHRDALIAAVKKATPEQLDKPLEKPSALFSTVGQAVAFLALHVALHAGQVTTIRRSLGRPLIV